MTVLGGEGKPEGVTVAFELGSAGSGGGSPSRASRRESKRKGPETGTHPPRPEAGGGR